jgi:hypothetical protein
MQLVGDYPFLCAGYYASNGMQVSSKWGSAAGRLQAETAAASRAEEMEIRRREVQAAELQAAVKYACIAREFGIEWVRAIMTDLGLQWPPLGPQQPAAGPAALAEQDPDAAQGGDGDQQGADGEEGEE